MAFRDDRDALLARAEALEREAERLREENESLRAEADAARAADADRAAADRAASDRRAEVERMAKRAPRPAPRAPKTAKPRPTGEYGHLVDDSMAPFWPRVLWPLGFIAVFPGLALVILGLSVLGDAIAVPAYVGMPLLLVVLGLYFVGHVVGVIALCGWVGRGEARRERRRLAALPIPLDLDGYLAVMATAQPSKTLEVRVAFATPPAEADRETVADAARSGRRVASAGWHSDELVIRSPSIDTYFTGKKTGWNNNVKVHRWFRRLARKVLVPIAKAYPMASVRVS